MAVNGFSIEPYLADHRQFMDGFKTQTGHHTALCDGPSVLLVGNSYLSSSSFLYC